MNEAPLFIQVPLSMLNDPTISDKAKLLYGRLKLYAGKNGQCNPKHSTLAREVGLNSDRQVRTVLSELRKAGWLNWRKGRLCSYYTVNGNKLPVSRAAEKCQSRPEENCRSDGKKTAGLDRKKTADRKDVLLKEDSKRTTTPPNPLFEGDDDETQKAKPTQKPVEGSASAQDQTAPSKGQKAPPEGQKLNLQRLNDEWMAAFPRQHQIIHARDVIAKVAASVQFPADKRPRHSIRGDRTAAKLRDLGA